MDHPFHRILNILNLIMMDIFDIIMIILMKINLCQLNPLELEFVVGLRVGIFNGIFVGVNVENAWMHRMSYFWR